MACDEDEIVSRTQEHIKESNESTRAMYTVSLGSYSIHIAIRTLGEMVAHMDTCLQCFHNSMAGISEVFLTVTDTI